MRLTVSNRNEMKYYIDTLCGNKLNQCKLILIRENGRRSELTINCSQQELYERWNKWTSGKYIQDVFDNLNDEEREFILTGITPEEWKKIFPSEEKE